MVLFAVMLYVAIGVGGCGWNICDRKVLMYVNFWQFSKNPPNSASVTDTMTFLMILHSTCTGPFSRRIDIMGVLLLDFGPRKQYVPALMCASGYEV